MIYFKIVTCLFLILTLASINAQMVVGRVLDIENQPVEDVNISVKGSSAHVHSAKDGKFELKIDFGSDTLVVFKEGFLPQEFLGYNITKLKYWQIELEEDEFSLASVTIKGSQSVVNQIINVDLATNTKSNTQELLTMVPGLFIAQHAGGGKSEQMFLRGFDLDHGTDINIAVDNMPVNMVSHAHGQGYTDLHFLMPEMVESITFEKGPYELKKGNFATAGYVDFKTRDKLTKNQVSIGYGSFNSKLINAAVNLLNDEKKGNAFIAGSFGKSDGYFETSQYLTRINLFGKYSRFISENVKLNISTSIFESSWDASGQIPERSVQDGSISRFGAIDDTEGGQTARKNIQVGITTYLPKRSLIKTSMYFTQNDFELYSNFTFFERDSVNGDQIRQKENRTMYGFNADYEKQILLGDLDLKFLAGMGIRIDDVNDLELSYTKNRIETLERVQYGNLDEANYFGYLGTEFNFKNFGFKGGVRAEEIVHRYENLLDTIYQPNEKTIYAFLPKFQVNYKLLKGLNLFGKWGQGFHSNDSRLVLNSANLEYLPLASSVDFGFDYIPSPKVILNAAVWQMFMQQEFVYVGDEGVVDLSGSTIRKGVDLSVTYSPFNFMVVNLNGNYTHARATEGDENYIPLAAPITVSGNMKFKLTNGVSLSWNSRYMGDRPADEANNAIAEGYFINDIKLGYTRANWGVSTTVTNLFNTEWKETQFLTQSRLANENEGVEEIHFTPGAPLALNVKFSYMF